MSSPSIGFSDRRATSAKATCPVVFQTRGPHQHFCGYYDVSPLDATGIKLLTHRVSESNRMPRAHDVVELGFWNIDSGEYFKLGETRAYNWQQGSKLQWLGPDFCSRVIYNDRDNDRFVSRIVDIRSGESRSLDFPIYTVHPDGKAAVCTNFERSYFPRESYSYQGVVKHEWNVPVHPDDGLFRLDLATGTRTRIIATAELVEYQPLSSMRGAPHYLEHAMYNTDGTRFVFLHRWQLPDGATYDRAYTANDDGTEPFLLLDSGLFSHCGWRNSGELTAWARLPSPVSLLRRYRAATKFLLAPVLPVYRRLLGPRNPLRAAIGGGTYVHFTDRSTACRPLDSAVRWLSDGHCTWHPGQRWMLTDTYEDERFDRHLYVYDSQERTIVEIGRFYSTPSTCSTGWRCDLHPRWSRTGDKVIVDSLHENDARQVYVLDVSGVVGGAPRGR